MANLSQGCSRSAESEGGTMTDTIRLLTLLEVADQLRLSTHTIRAMVRKDRLRPVRLCSRLLFDPADVQRLVDEAR